jgi:hypothetical protein
VLMRALTVHTVRDGRKPGLNRCSAVDDANRTDQKKGFSSVLSENSHELTP